MNMNIKSQLYFAVAPLIGHTIDLEHIYSDQNPFCGYLTERCLQAGHPLILIHYNGFVMMVIPSNDWELLEERTISVEDYIDNSVWNYGFLWSGGSILEDLQWQPFESNGIYATSKISRYLRILKCRTQRISSANKFNTSRCTICPIEQCPVSDYAPKALGSSWVNEVTEFNDRISLYMAVKEYLEETFGLNATSCKSHNDGDTVLLTPGNKNTLTVYFPQQLLLDLMYNPRKYDIKKIADQLKYEAAILEKGGFKHVLVPESANVQFFYDYWKNN